MNEEEQKKREEKRQALREWLEKRDGCGEEISYKVREKNGKGGKRRVRVIKEHRGPKTKSAAE